MTEVSILADNEVATPAPTGLRAEWGFAAAVGPVLFDAGQTGIVPRNAALLGETLDFETVVLSHGHYDHTEGLDAVLDRLDDPTVYCHPSLWQSRYVEAGGDRRHIGTPYTKTAIEDRATVVEHTEPIEVADGIHALGEIPREHPDAAVGYLETADGSEPDPVVDDQALVVETGDGLGVILGCGHAGLRNTVEYAERTFGETVRHVIGGTHLVAVDEPEIRAIADDLAGQLELFAGTHCTGTTGQRVFAERLPDATVSAGVGSVFEL